MEVNVQKMIKVIEKHRVLYDNTSKEYYDRIKRRHLWEEVCNSLHPSWETADENEKMLFGKEVQKKWQSLRDCFRRELVSQKIPPEARMKKKAKYKYFDELEFLTPYTQSPSADTSEQESVTFLINDLESSSYSKDPLVDYEPSRKKKRIEDIADDEISVPREMSLIRDGSRYMDDDEAFLMSLLPSFKEYALEDKYLLRIELMKTILKFKRSQREERRLSVSVKCEHNEDDYST